MELEIQKWVKKFKPFDEEAEELFNEGIECYKVGANKAAFIMSYLAYEKTIQNRILSFKGIPINITAEKWEETRKNIDDEYYWERNILNEIKKNNGIMRLRNKKYIVSKVETYKETRNACIHGKLKRISSSVVEEFWDFLKNNISGFNINGGKEYFKEALFKAFRDRNEEINITYDNLLDELSVLDLCEEELIDIWDYLNENFKRLYGVSEEDIKDFWNKILLNKNNKIQESFIKFTEKSCNKFIEFYMLNESLLDLALNTSDGMLFKKEVVYQWVEDGEPALYRNEAYWNFIISMLEYIPKDDIIGFFKLIDVYKIEDIPSSTQCEILKEKGFFKEIKKYILTELKYNYNEAFNQMNRLNFTVCAIKNNLDMEIIRRLADFWEKLSAKSYPGITALRYGLDGYIFADKKLMEQIKEIIAENEEELILNENIEKMIQHSERCLF
ncbi:hypothetical protein [Clostridium neonatale]|uniref:Uncharacterized protein n=2 Tax=root TaxID=1 RepID=A0A8S5UJC5_9CAUD|nr:hypothetical protein CNEO3_1060003 [Clostridium neonatale]DAF94575.1 MAG TPA: hypothetical protein [Siphoviridae sp. ct3gT1]CAI3548687.1 hypothetical protein CNEO3_1250003 [Clostridium neonatale]CAI3557378.1 hypothetical protein CNEO3_1140003 [Clostridium neonatale]CAI3567790.1 hypothetical protein CNEO3_1250003 [Clostridium neonatale]